MINFSLAREIYGLTPWFVDAHSLPGLLGVLKNVSILSSPDSKLNSVSLLNPSNNTRVIYSEWDLKYDDNDFDAVAVINLDGPITLNGGESSLGMKKLSDRMLRLANDSRVKAFVILANSGGGASGAVKIMSNTINLVKLTKPVYGCIQNGGMAASACFGILSACDKIYSEDDMNIVGSAGTMIEFAGRKANTEDPDGRKHVRLYATKSTAKNKGFEEALNNDNYSVLIDELLDPVNEAFLTLIETNRPILKGTNFNDGHTVFSKDAIGTFIDGIKSFDEVVESVLEDDKIVNFNNSNSLNNLNNNNMTKAELKSKHPEVYNDIYNEGVSNGTTAEADRSGAWLAHLSTDPTAVVAGIDSGKSISQKETQQFIVKQASNSQLANLTADAAAAVVTEPASGAEGAAAAAAATDVDNFYAGVDSKLNLKKNK